MKQSIVTLIAAPGQTLSAASDDISKALIAGGASCDSPMTLAENRAVDIAFDGLDEEKARQIVTKTLNDLPIDAVVQPTANRRKKLLISDMDSTMIEQECIDELADFIGKKEYVSKITERAMNGELDFKEALIKRVALLANLPETALEETYLERITMTPGGKELVAVMKKNGAVTILVSGGFTYFTNRVRDALDFDRDEANILEMASGRLSGLVKEPILDKDAKLASLNHHRQRLNLKQEQTLAVGDGANDLPMLLAAGLGVAYHAKPAVREQTKAAIHYNDLRSILYLQGYKDQEIDNL